VTHGNQFRVGRALRPCGSGPRTESDEYEDQRGCTEILQAQEHHLADSRRKLNALPECRRTSKPDPFQEGQLDAIRVSGGFFALLVGLLFDALGCPLTCSTFKNDRSTFPNRSSDRGFET